MDGAGQPVRRTATSHTLRSGAGARRIVLPLLALVLFGVTSVLAHYGLAARQYMLYARDLSLRLERELRQARQTVAANATQQHPQEGSGLHPQQQLQPDQQPHKDTAGTGVLASPDSVEFGTTQCLETCCWRYEDVQWHYAGEKGRRPTLDDRLSPGESKTLADVVLHGSYPIPEWMGQPPFMELREDLLPCLQPGTVIFIEGNTKQQFFDQLHPRIKHPYILISGDGDDSSPGEYRRFIDDPKILAWWGFNCDFPGIHKVPKFHCYPLGLTQWWDARDAMHRLFEDGEVPLHWEADPATAADFSASKLFLANYDVGTNKAARTVAHNYFCTGPLANYSSCTSSNDRDLPAYFRRVREHMFNVAPEGAGLDSYRIWETMYLGRYPVVLNSTIDESFAGLPVWIVERWEDVTVESAHAVFELFSRKQWEWGKLYKGWWQRRIYDLRPTNQKNVRVAYTRPSGQQ